MSSVAQDEMIAEQDGGGGSFFADIPAILMQRKWYILIPLVVLSLAGVAAAFLLPATYRSKAVLLVQSPQLQTDQGGQVSSEAIDERVAKVRQQVLSRPDLIAIAQELQLYPEERARSSLGELIDKMRKAITIEPVSAQIQQRSGSQSTTIAFSMAFDYKDPEAAQAVTQKLVERVLEVDSTRTAQLADDNVRFLTQQADAIRERMAVVEQQLTAIKSRYGQVLSSTGMAMLGGSGGSLDAQIAALERETSQLRAQREAVKASAPRDSNVMAAEAQLAAARAIYSETHPDVIFAKQRLAEAKVLAAKNIATIPFDTLDSQIVTNNGQIAILRAARSRESSQTSSILNAQSRAPVIQEQVAQLEKQLTGMNQQYQDTTTKLSAATTAQRIETEQKGERLTVVDPPVVDDDPIWPDRILVSVGGVAGGLALGLLLALAVELVIHPVRGPRAVVKAAGAELLGAIPTIAARSERKRRNWLAWLPWAGRSRRASAEA